MAQILDLDPATYVRHRTHRGERIWAETNCYTDVVIEMLHGMGLEPLAAMPFTLAVDFDVDQWTFFKFPAGDIEDLYALAFQELAPWKPLAEHVQEHVAAGRPILVELDSFFLPDTAGTAFRLAHVKSTVAVNAIDLAAETLGYFHNQGYHALEGQDFRDILQTEGLAHPRMLPPYIEFVKKIPGRSPLRGTALTEASLAALRRQLGRLPPTNPFAPFRARFERDQAWLLQAPIDSFHAYSFATLRQLGAAYELAATYLEWLGEQGVSGTAGPAACFVGISQSSKALQFQLARSMARKRPLDLAPLDAMAALWDQGTGELRRLFG
jgi:hypothetical protein